jgi:hypothetical protein
VAALEGLTAPEALVLAHGAGTIVEVAIAVVLFFLVVAGVVWTRRVEAREQTPPE